MQESSDAAVSKVVSSSLEPSESVFLRFAAKVRHGNTVEMPDSLYVTDRRLLWVSTQGILRKRNTLTDVHFDDISDLASGTSRGIPTAELIAKPGKVRLEFHPDREDVYDSFCETFLRLWRMWHYSIPGPHGEALFTLPEVQLWLDDLTVAERQWLGQARVLHHLELYGPGVSSPPPEALIPAELGDTMGILVLTAARLAFVAELCEWKKALGYDRSGIDRIERTPGDHAVITVHPGDADKILTFEWGKRFVGNDHLSPASFRLGLPDGTASHESYDKAMARFMAGAAGR